MPKKKNHSKRNPHVWFLINYLMHVALRLTLYAKCIKISFEKPQRLSQTLQGERQSLGADARSP